MKIPSVAWGGTAWDYFAVVAVVDHHRNCDAGVGMRWNSKRDAVIWRSRRMLPYL